MVGVSEKCQGKIHADRLSLRGKTGTILDLFHGMHGTCFLINFGRNCDGKARNRVKNVQVGVAVLCVTFELIVNKQGHFLRMLLSGLG